MLRAVLVLALVACGGGSPKKEAAPRPMAAPAAEPEEDDGVEVVSARGHMEEADVEAGLAPHTQAMQQCFLDRIGKKRWLGGNVKLVWQITRAGVVTQVAIAESDLGSWAVEKCLLEHARKATFAKPKGGDADFSIPLTFEGKSAPVVWDPAIAEKAVAKKIADLGKCAKQGAPGDAVTITIYVGTRGKVQSAGFASSAAIPDAWADCAAKLIESWTLADPRGKVAKFAITHRG